MKKNKPADKNIQKGSNKPSAMKTTMLQRGNEDSSPDDASKNDEKKSKRRSIEQLIKDDQLKQALDDFEKFLKLCEETTPILTHTQARLSGVDILKQKEAIGPEAKIERNKIRMDFQAQLAEFRENVLAKYFDLHGEAEFLAKITSRDQVIHEILDRRLMPKRYKRDENWQKVEGNSSIIYRLFNYDTQRHAIAMVIKMPEIEPALKEEINRLADLRHRNIIKLLDHEISSFPYFVITEYVYGENLPDALEIVGKRPAAQAADWLFQLTDALDYLRHKRILHTNVRPSKIYIDDEWQIMISPFDLIKAPSSGPGSPDPGASDQPKDNPGERTFNRYRDVCQYGSPELFERDGECFHDTHKMCISDMYSIGLIGYKILTGEDLFEGSRLFDIIESRRRFEQDETYRAKKLSKLPNDTQLSIIVGNLLKNREEREIEYGSLRKLLHALNPLTMAEQYSDSVVMNSYRRCLANSREFINDFYDSFLKTSRYAGDFDNLIRKRQSVMLQMAIDILLDLDQKEHLLVKLVESGSKHSKYHLIDFSMFFNILIDTVKKHDHCCKEDASLQAEWYKVRDDALNVIRKARSKKKG